MNKKTDNKNPFKSLGVGYAHYLRNGAGAHKDRKKESNKKQCRVKMKASDWKSSFLHLLECGKYLFRIFPTVNRPIKMLYSEY